MIEDKYATKKILFEKHLDSSLHIVSKGLHLKYQEIAEQSKVEQKKMGWSNIPKAGFNRE